MFNDSAVFLLLLLSYMCSRMGVQVHENFQSLLVGLAIVPSFLGLLDSTDMNFTVVEVGPT